jgi:hypothetical protein
MFSHIPKEEKKKRSCSLCMCRFLLGSHDARKHPQIHTLAWPSLRRTHSRGIPLQHVALDDNPCFPLSCQLNYNMCHWVNLSQEAFREKLWRERELGNHFAHLWRLEDDFKTVYLWSKVVCLFCFVLMRSWDASDCVLGVFGKVLMRRGAWTWFREVWTCSAKSSWVLNYFFTKNKIKL